MVTRFLRVLGAAHEGGEDLVVVLAPAEVAGNAMRQFRRGWGSGLTFRNPTVAMMKPDMQKAHWKPCSSTTPCCTGCSVPSALARPSMVTIFLPRAVCVSTEQE